jgi:hypothetical protein
MHLPPHGFFGYSEFRSFDRAHRAAELQRAVEV